MTNLKQVLVVRTDLCMSIGKMISQACHASLEASEITRKKNKDKWLKWKKEGAKKIVVSIESKEELFMLKMKAGEQGITCYLVSDAGLTEIEPGTYTALAIGPDIEEIIDKVTGSLKLLN